jgi:hypothetical protein
MRNSAGKIASIVFCAANGQKYKCLLGTPQAPNMTVQRSKNRLLPNRKKQGENAMKTEKKKRGRPPKIFTAETSGMTYEGAINYALDKEVKSELDKILADKGEKALTEDELKYIENCKENKSRTLNIRFTESEYRDIEDKCEQFGYKSKSTYVRDCVKARVNFTVEKADFSVTNRLIKSIGNNINQIAIRLHSTGHFYAEDLAEIKRGVNRIWQLLLSMGSKRQSGQQSDTSLTEIRPSTAYMSNLMLAGQTAEEQARTSAPSEGEEQGGHKSLHTT